MKNTNQPKPVSAEETKIPISNEELYNALGDGYGFNGKKEDALKIIDNFCKIKLTEANRTIEERDMEIAELRQSVFNHVKALGDCQPDLKKSNDFRMGNHELATKTLKRYNELKQAADEMREAFGKITLEKANPFKPRIIDSMISYDNLTKTQQG